MIAEEGLGYTTGRSDDGSMDPDDNVGDEDTVVSKPLANQMKSPGMLLTQTSSLNRGASLNNSKNGYFLQDSSRVYGETYTLFPSQTGAMKAEFSKKQSRKEIEMDFPPLENNTDEQTNPEQGQVASKLKKIEIKSSKGLGGHR